MDIYYLVMDGVTKITPSIKREYGYEVPLVSRILTSKKYCPARRLDVLAALISSKISPFEESEIEHTKLEDALVESNDLLKELFTTYVATLVGKFVLSSLILIVVKKSLP
ncbi:hypothetical protein EB001_25625 [bacterium]|nr:hypothetical protein [bacterium]